MSRSHSYSYPHKPVVFDEFFAMGFDESASPFITPSSRHWAKQIPLRSAVIASVLLIGVYILQIWTVTQPLSYLLLIGVYFLAGIPSLIESTENAARLEINIDVLMTLAAFLSVLIGSPIEGGLLLVLFALSGAMEDAVTAKAKGAINSLYKLSPIKAYVIEPDGSLIERSVRDVNVGTKILIKAGETIPLDSKVLEGISSVNLVHLTGENLPVIKKVGNDVPAGAINYEGALVLEVTHTSADSSIARIIKLVTQAQEAKPQIQRWFDSVSKRYAATVILLSGLFAMTLPWLISIPYLGFEGSVYRAIAFLIAASPCALIIATPIAYLSAISSCARSGILLKGGVTLDALAGCQVIAFDKTGTLTLGNLRCIDMNALQPGSKKQLIDALSVAVALEQNAVHPIARAIIKYAEDKPTELVQLRDFRSIPGYGLEANYQGKQVFIGKISTIAEKLPATAIVQLNDYATEIQRKGDLLAVMLLGQDVYVFRFEDTVRPKMQETLGKLKADGWQLLMLTGDHQESAKKIAETVGIEDFKADLRPEDKLNIVSQIAQEKGLAMVGDGVNDAPALARATVGICMGQVGSSTAIEAADVVLLHDNLDQLEWLMRKARKTLRIVHENMTLAAGVILLATTPALMGYIPLWLAVALHEGGTVLVGLNALRLLDKAK